MSKKKSSGKARKSEKKEEKVQPIASEDLPYSVGAWKGITQYRCKRCPFDTLNLADMQAHINARHAPIPSRLVDRFGNQLT
jgi:hypothetical protein